MLLDVAHQPSSSSYLVTRPELAAVLVNTEYHQLLRPFFANAVSVAEAARQTGTKPNTMYVQVKRLADIGLLVVEREVPRTGRAIKLYRTAAERYFVPFEVMNFETLEAMSRKLNRFWESELRRAVTRAKVEAIGSWGYQVGLNARGEMAIQSSLGPEAVYDANEAREPAVIDFWDDELRLDFEDAKALQQELLGIYWRYKAKGGAQSYFIRLGLAARVG